MQLGQMKERTLVKLTTASASCSKAGRPVTNRPVGTKSKSPKPQVEWQKMKPKISSQPMNNEKQMLSEIVEKLVDKSEVEPLCQSF